MKTNIDAKNVTFKLRDVQQLAEQNLGAVAMEEWAAVCRRVKAVEEDYMSREHEMDSVMEIIKINADYDDDMSESTVSCNCLILLLNLRFTMLLGSLSYVFIVVSNAGYTMFRGRVEEYWLTTLFACFPFTSPPVRHRVPSDFNWTLLLTTSFGAPIHVMAQPSHPLDLSWSNSPNIFTRNLPDFHKEKKNNIQQAKSVTQGLQKQTIHT